ncbi:antitermination protein NusG [candidate division KSB1 bacterium]|nr:MAG: antitermination protein NusG [candidate division KSB1 bacterium]
MHHSKINIKEELLFDKGWYALYTKSRHEKVVVSQIEDMGIECYAPLKEVVSFWSDRKKIIQKPLFPSYVFVYGDKKERYRAVQAEGAVMYITFNGRPARVLQEEIDLIKRFLKEDKSVQPCEYFNKGDLVEIIRGPLSGYKGILKEINNKYRFVVNIDSINQGLCVNISINDVKHLKVRA